MVGHWAWIDTPAHLQPGDCPESEFYGRNGYVTTGQDVHEWWIEGNTLVRVVVEPMDSEAVGTTYRNRFIRVSRKKLLFKGDGGTQWMVRCGDTPPEWEYRPRP